MTAHTSAGVVRFAETDASGRFHYAAALMWAENAEHELYRSLGLPVVSFPRRTVSASFERPLVDGDEYVVELDVDRLGTTSITYDWRVRTGSDVAVAGSHTVVHVDASGRSAELPATLRAALTTSTPPDTKQPR